MLDTQHLTGLITCDPEIVSGAPVFAGTRVPIKNLFDYFRTFACDAQIRVQMRANQALQAKVLYLKGGHDLAEFFEDFPSVSEEQAKGVLELAKDSLSALLASKSI